MKQNISYDDAKKLFLDGLSLSKIEKTFIIDRHKLSRLLKEDGVVIPINNKIFSYNDQFFKKIDTEEKAYWLGFLYADGYIANDGKKHIIELCLAEKDMSHVQKFQKLMCHLKPIALKKSVLNDKLFLSYRYSVTDINIVNDIIALGCTPNKSLTVKYPDITQDLNRHFIRGYFDGDGSITYSGDKILLSLCSGSIEFLNSIQNIYINEIEDYTEVKILFDKRSNVKTLSKGGLEAPLALLDYLYKDCLVYLDRKYQKYLAIKQDITNCRLV